MGDLHEGHLSLIRRARAECDVVVVSDFVNPTQFAAGEDYERYPRNLESDVELCAMEGVDIVFAPSPHEMYREGSATYVVQEGLTEKLCGASRPVHFRGVTTIVAKLFNIVLPTASYWGQKDAQQVTVIKRMVVDLNFATRVVVCPIVREPDGLAISSRNRYLSSDQRQDALSLSRSLNKVREMIASGETNSAPLRRQMCEVIERTPSAKIDYVAIVHSETLEDVDNIDREVLVAVAARFGRARLIDNILVSPPAQTRK
jgi:pantoate--beta-alanine ligase